MNGKWYDVKCVPEILNDSKYFPTVHTVFIYLLGNNIVILYFIIQTS